MKSISVKNSGLIRLKRIVDDRDGTHFSDSGLEPEKISKQQPRIIEIPIKDAEDIRRNHYVKYYRSLCMKKQNPLKKIIIGCLPYGIVSMIRRIRGKR